MDENKELDVNCPLCKEFITKATIDDLSNGLRLRCIKCTFSVWIEDGYISKTIES